MASLDRHTLSCRLEEHARLPFRPDCPYCRQVRLRGPLPSREIVPRRVKAGLLAGTLAASGAAPAAPAIGQPPQSNAEGGAAVLPPGGIEADDAAGEGEPPAVELGGAPEQAGPPVTGPRPEVKPPGAAPPPRVDPEAAPSEPTTERQPAPPPGSDADEPAAAPAPEAHRQQPEDDALRPAPSDGTPQAAPRQEPGPVSVPEQEPPEPSRAEPREQVPERQQAPIPGAHAEKSRPAPAPEPPREAPQDDGPGRAPSDGTSQQAEPWQPESGAGPERQPNSGPSPPEARDGAPEHQQPSPEANATEPGPAPAPDRRRHEPQEEGTRPAPREGESEQAAGRGERKPSSEREIGESGGSEADKRRDGVGGARLIREADSSGRDRVGRGGGHKRSEASVGAAQVAEAERVHVVKPGESLWAIAEKRLGPRASDAEIAREVNRLWELNATKVIKTGDPDLILPGQRLRL
jgi:hypothetical protein